MNIKLEKYNDYLNSHIENTNKAFGWLVENLPDLFQEFDSDHLGVMISLHDMSKWDEEEYSAYCDYFYGEKTNEVKEAFDFAWLHHIHHNPHHWQYWLLQEDEGEVKALEMPTQYVVEMISDWWAFSWKANNLYEIFDWYDDHKKKINVHKNTRELIEDILARIKDKLDEDNNDKE